MSVPVILAHVRLTTTVPIENLDALRDAIIAVVKAHTESELWGVRIKRRQLSAKQWRELFAQYEKRVLVAGKP